MSRDTLCRWLVILVLVLAETIWMRAIGLRLVDNGLGVLLVAVVPLMLVAFFYSYTGRSTEISDLAQIAAQFILMLAATAVLSYLAVSTNRPLIDSALAAIDQRFGLD